jgi:hypothetical protein
LLVDRRLEHDAGVVDQHVDPFRALGRESLHGRFRGDVKSNPATARAEVSRVAKVAEWSRPTEDVPTRASSAPAARLKTPLAVVRTT